MRPVVTPEAMREVDAAAADRIDELIAASGWAVARAALGLLGGSGYGRRVAVVAGRGNNGADGRAAAAILARRGARITIVSAAEAPPVLRGFDLVVDAAYGTGGRAGYVAPDPGGAPVLAVDLPSGLDPLTGAADGRPPLAVATIALVALKPGLLLADGPPLAGDVEVADIGLAAPPTSIGEVIDADVTAWVPSKERTAHKWQRAVWVIGGSPGMHGAPALAAAAAARAGAGYVRRSIPGEPHGGPGPLEGVAVELPAAGWDSRALDDLGRIGAVVLGPGIGRAAHTRRAAARLARSCPVALVVDGDALHAFDAPDAIGVGRRVVLTPHDGEFAALTGAPPGTDRMAAARRLAARAHAVVLLKGPTTVVADPAGRIALCTAGDQRLATAGSGDVLSGVIGAFLARGMDPFEAAAAGAHVHGRAGARTSAQGAIAGDLPREVAVVLDDLVRDGR